MAVVALLTLVAVVAMTIAGFIAGPIARGSPPMVVVVMVVVLVGRVGRVGSVGIYKGLPAALKSWDGKVPFMNRY